MIDEREMPSGTVTLLFTDIEGSTRLWQQQPEVMAEALADHDRVVQQTLTECGGRVFGVGGDGFFAAFDTAAGAVEAATAIAKEFKGPSIIDVRIGLHTGEVQLRDGAYFGAEVNRTARIATAANGGQVLASHVTAALLPTAGFRSLGTFELRGLEGESQLFQLGDEAFPALRIDSIAGNVVVPRNGFLGRERELGEITRALRRHPVVTLTGVGGIGKTRLALQCASDSHADFPGGTWIARLASLTEPSLIADSISDELGIRGQATRGAEDALCDWFKSRDALLVLDNCEHLVDSVAALCNRLAELGTGSRVLATSQVPFGFAGEQVLPIGPLDGDETGADSTRLFVERAIEARPDFTAEGAALDAVRSVCDKLDHIPLAVELAASRCGAMTPAELSSRLDHDLRFLTSRDRLAPDRHRTLDAAVRWSHDLLEPRDQAVLCRLGVFAAPFTLDHAQALAASDDLTEWDVADAVVELVDRSLVAVTFDEDVTRYHLLETIKSFARQELEQAGELDQRTAAFVDLYQLIAIDRGNQLMGPDDRVAIAAIDADWPNIRVALQAAADDTNTSRFEEMYAALAPVWNAHGRAGEGAQWARELVQRPMLDPALRAAALVPAAGALNIQETGGGNAFADEAEDLWRRHGTEAPVGAFANRALDAMLSGEDELARQICNQVLAWCEGVPDGSWNRDHAITNVLSVLSLVDEDLERFEAVFESEMDKAKHGRSEWYRITLRSTSSQIADRMASIDDPVAFVTETVELLRGIGNLQTASHSQSGLTVLHLRQGDFATAAEVQLEAIELAVEHAPAYVAIRLALGVGVLMTAEPEAAIQLLGFVQADRAGHGSTGTTRGRAAEEFYESVLKQSRPDAFDSLLADGAGLEQRAAVELACAALRRVAQSPERS